MENFRPELFVIALVGLLAPLLSELPARFRLPVVAIKILLGIAIGPQLLNLASPDGLVGMFGLNVVMGAFAAGDV